MVEGKINPDELLELARKGSQAWNKEIVFHKGGIDFTGTDFSTSENSIISFEGFIFPSAVIFKNCVFPRMEHQQGLSSGEHENFMLRYAPGPGNFSNCIFNDEAIFTGAVLGTACFNECVFESGARFDYAIFEGSATFNRSVFKSGFNCSHAVFLEYFEGRKCRFEGDVEFRRGVFFFPVSFCGAIFEESASFYKAIFRSSCDFQKVVFTYAYFDVSEGEGLFSIDPEEDMLGEYLENVHPQRRDAYKGIHKDSLKQYGLFFDINFDRAEFRCHADFSGRDFRSEVAANKCKFHFHSPPIFRDCKNLGYWNFQTVVIRVGYGEGGALPWWQTRLQIAWSSDFSLPEKYRELRKIAIERHEYDLELEFFALERLAHRGLELGKGKFGRAIFTSLYSWTSDFGRSAARPFVVWLMASILSYWICWQYVGRYKTVFGFDEDLLVIALGKSLPFLPSLGESVKSSTQRIFGHIGEQTFVPLFVEVVWLMQSLTGLICLFLILLAFRNYYRIKS